MVFTECTIHNHIRTIRRGKVDITQKELVARPISSASHIGNNISIYISCI